LLMMFGFSFSSFVIVHSILKRDYNQGDEKLSSLTKKSLVEGIENISWLFAIIMICFSLSFILECTSNQRLIVCIDIMFYSVFVFSVLILVDLFVGVLNFLRSDFR
jgi:hypothetical protein